AGFRYVNLEEDLTINERTAPLPGNAVTIGGLVGPFANPVLPPNSVAVADRFDTRNQFYGGQIGARGEWEFGPVLLGASGKLALGWTHETQNVQGTTTLVTPAGPAGTVPGGFLALPTNIGRRSQDE